MYGNRNLSDTPIFKAATNERNGRQVKTEDVPSEGQLANKNKRHIERTAHALFERVFNKLSTKKMMLLVPKKLLNDQVLGTNVGMLALLSNDSEALQNFEDAVTHLGAADTSTAVIYPMKVSDLANKFLEIEESEGEFSLAECFFLKLVTDWLLCTNQRFATLLEEYIYIELNKEKPDFIHQIPAFCSELQAETMRQYERLEMHLRRF